MESIDRKTRENACNKAQSIVDEVPKVGEAALPPGEHEPGFVLAYGIYLKPTALTYTGCLPSYPLMNSLPRMLERYSHHMGRMYLERGEDENANDHLVRS